jgi:type IVB pilus formation R64 PilN family outer membrane protein
MGDTVISDTGISEDGSFSMLELKGNDVLQNIYDVAIMLKSEEGRLTLDKSTTSIVVRDFPENVRRIKDYITTQNARITAQAVFDIMIIDYIKTSGDEVTFNIDLIRNDLASAGIQSLTTGFASSLIGSITPTVLTYTRKEGKYAGASAILAALKSRGAVLNVINPSLIVTNNRISKIVDSSDRAYLASAGSSQTANVGQTAILTPGIVKTGLKLWALADINLKDDSIMAKVANSFSDLVDISTASSGGSTIQTPSTSTNEFDQTFFMHDGETILLGGLGTNRQEVTENTGGALGIGGEKGVKYIETETLILITPRIIRK